MLIEKAKLEKIFELVALKDEASIKSILIDITKNKGVIITSSPNKTLALRAELYHNFDDLNGEKLGIIDINTFKKTLNSIETKVNIKKSSNKLVLTPDCIEKSLKISIALKSPDYIENIIKEETFNNLKTKALGNEFVVEGEYIKRIKEYFDNVDTKKFTLKNSNKKLIFKVEDIQNEIEYKTNVEGIKDFDVILPKSFIDVLSLLNEDVTISLKNDSPAYIKIKNKNYMIEYLVSPNTR